MKNNFPNIIRTITRNSRVYVVIDGKTRFSFKEKSTPEKTANKLNKLLVSEGIVNPTLTDSIKTNDGNTTQILVA